MYGESGFFLNKQPWPKVCNCRSCLSILEYLFFFQTEKNTECYQDTGNRVLENGPNILTKNGEIYCRSKCKGIIGGFKYIGLQVHVWINLRYVIL